MFWGPNNSKKREKVYDLGIMKKEYKVINWYQDVTGHIRFSSLLRAMQDAAGDDSEHIGYGKDKVFDKGYRWVIARIAGKIKRMPLGDETMVVTTFPEKNKLFFYPRFTSVSVNGKLALECDTIWAIIDGETRKPLLPKECGVIIDPKPECEKTMTIDSKMIVITPTKSLERKVMFTDLDTNNHMNNTVYVDWAYDLLGSGWIKERQLEEFRMSYHTEALEGETLRMDYEITDTEIYVLGSVGERKVYEVYLKFIKL